MGGACPVCGKESTENKCGTCGFEMPGFGFLSKEDADKWFQDAVFPYREDWERRKAGACKNCGKETREGWKLCPYCGMPLGESSKPPAPETPPEAVPKGLVYKTVDNKRRVVIERYKGSAVSVAIPALINGLPVTSIGNGAFRECEGLANVYIPPSVMTIGNSAFQFCGALANVSIPPSVTSIGEWAFWGCGGLKNAGIPPSVTHIGLGAFDGCVALTNVSIPPSVTSIRDSAFKDCIGLASVTIPPSVTSIGDYAFSGCVALASVSIPPSVTSIGEYAFSGCVALASVTIPPSVTFIGEYAFSGCKVLLGVTLSGHTNVEKGAFPDWTQVEFKD